MRQLLDLTKERCGAAVYEEDIMEVMAKLVSRPADMIRKEIDQPLLS